MKNYLLISMTAFAILSCSGESAPASKDRPATAAATPEASAKHVTPVDIDQIVVDRFKGALKPGAIYTARVTLINGGTFDLLLYSNLAPNHAANFVSLTRKGFYDGVTFHRVLEGFMAQGGDPTGSGSGGPGYTIPAEFSNIPHVRGTLSMARSNDPNSGGSQFFICFGPTPMLDGKYTVFGEVTKGMEIVDRLKRRDPDKNPQFQGDMIRTVEILETSAK